MTRIRSMRPFICTLKRIDCLKEGLEVGGRSGEGSEGRWQGCPGPPGSKGAGLSPVGILSLRGILSPGGALATRGFLSPRDSLSCMEVSLRSILSWKGGSSPRGLSCHRQGSCPQGTPCPEWGSCPQVSSYPQGSSFPGWGSCLQGVFCPHRTSRPHGVSWSPRKSQPRSTGCCSPCSLPGTAGHPRPSRTPQPPPRDRRSPSLAPHNALTAPPSSRAGPPGAAPGALLTLLCCRKKGVSGRSEEPSWGAGGCFQNRGCYFVVVERK